MSNTNSDLTQTDLDKLEFPDLCHELKIILNISMRLVDKLLIKLERRE